MPLISSQTSIVLSKDPYLSTARYIIYCGKSQHIVLPTGDPEIRKSPKIQTQTTVSCLVSFSATNCLRMVSPPTVMPVYLGAPMDENSPGADPIVIFTATLHHAEQIKGKNRGLIDKAKGIYQFNDLVVLKTARMPAILLECGIIVNRDQEILLRNRSYQKMLIFSLVASIERFCEFSQNKEKSTIF